MELPCARGRQFVTVTAVAESPTGVRIGFDAVDEADAQRLYVAFKSPDLNKDSVAKPISLFVAQMRAELIDAGKLRANRATRWVFGAPSGWDDAVVRKYKKILTAAGLADVEIVPESRAAMLYARDSGELNVDSSKLEGSVLVVDLGSSTTDFTGVVGLKIRPVDTGTSLGAGLIDKAIMNWLLDVHKRRHELQRVLEEWPIEEARLELACRSAKEDYFRNQAASRGNGQVSGGYVYEPLRPDDADIFSIKLTTADMDQILATSHPVLDGKNWLEKFRSDLETAAVGLDYEPELVLLTGGASRMLFVRQIAREMFGNDRVATGAEPEIAIARGLALAGRIGIRAQGFRNDMARLLRSGQVASLVEGRLDELAEALGNAVGKGFIGRFARPAFDRWQNGSIATLAEFESEVGAKAKAEVSNPNNPVILSTIATWQNALHPDLAQMTRPICDRWKIPRSAMELAPVTLSSRDWNLSLDLTEVMATQMAKIAGWVAGIVVGAIFAAMLAGGVFTGPLFIVIGVVAVSASASGANEKVKEKIRIVEIPLWVRRRFKADTVFQNAASRERELAADVAHRISSENADAIVAQVSRRLETELKELAAAAELMIS